MARLSKKNEALLKAVQKQAARRQAAVEAASGNTIAQNASDNAAVNGSGNTLAKGSGSASASGLDNAAAKESDNTLTSATKTAGTHTPSLSKSSSAVGLGVDLVEIDRMEKALERTPRIAERVFTSAERAYAWSKARPATHYAAFFAAREATLKALGTGFAGMDFADVEVAHNENGKPEVVLHNNAKEIAEKQGIVDIQVSLSHTHQMAVASVVAIKEQSSPPKVEYIDPMDELTRRFKELRSLIDDIGAGDLITDVEQDEQGEQGEQDERSKQLPKPEPELEQVRELELTSTTIDKQPSESEQESAATNEQEHE